MWLVRPFEESGSVPPPYNLILTPSLSDQLLVTHAEHNPEGWSLRLTALSADEPQRLVRFLTGALLACGGWILTRTTQGNEAAELNFEFSRASCVEIYAVLIAAGLELSRDSHLQMADLCHCTKNLIETHAWDIAHAGLVVYRSDSKPGHSKPGHCDSLPS